MSFLFPLYLLGIAAVAAPIILHLRRRPPKERTEFSSLMFLEASPLQRKSRRRLENLLLLLLRCALICLLALLFSRPLFRGGGVPDASGEGKLRVLLVDRSASMRRADLWNDALKIARRHAEKAASGDRVALVVFDRDPSLVLEFGEWSEAAVSRRPDLLDERLGAVVPGWGRTRFDSAIAFAVELLEEEKSVSPAGGTGAAKAGAGAGNEVVLVSDLQEGGDIQALRAVGWPEDAVLVVEVVEPRDADNASLHLLASENVLTLAPGDRGETRGGAGPRGPRLRVMNEAVSTNEKFMIARKGGAEGDVPVRVAPGMQLTVRMPPAGPNEERDPVLLLEGDANDFDNRVYLAPAAKRPLRVLYFGAADEEADDVSRPYYYLKRAIQATQLHEPWVSNEIPRELNLVETADFIVVADAPPDELHAPLREYLEDGGNVLFLLRNPRQGELLGKLLGVPGIKIEDARFEDKYVLLEDIEFENSLLGAFNDPRVRDFSKIHFWNYRRLAGEAAWPGETKLLARFDSGDPAWLAVPVGRGELVLFAAAWHPEDSQLGVSTKFVPLLYSLIEGGGRGVSQRAQFTVGDPLPVTGGAVVRRPDGEEVVVGENQSYFEDTGIPGVYTVVQGSEQTAFAVNLSTRESRTAPLGADRFAEAGILVSGAESGVAAADQAPREAPDRKRYLLDVEREKKQQFWRWLLVGAVIVVFLEMLFPGRRAQPASEEPV